MTAANVSRSSFLLTPPPLTATEATRPHECKTHPTPEFSAEVEAKIKEILDAEHDWLKDRLEYRLRELCRLAMKHEKRQRAENEGRIGQGG